MTYSLRIFDDVYHMVYVFDDGVTACHVDFKHYLMTFTNDRALKMVDSYFYCWEATC